MKTRLVDADYKCLQRAVSTDTEAHVKQLILPGKKWSWSDIDLPP